VRKGFPIPPTLLSAIAAAILVLAAAQAGRAQEVGRCEGVDHTVRGAPLTSGPLGPDTKGDGTFKPDGLPEVPAVYTVTEGFLREWFWIGNGTGAVWGITMDLGGTARFKNGSGDGWDVLGEFTCPLQ